jgi:hypothetical protein
MAMSLRSKKEQAAESNAHEAGAEIREFLERNLPPEMTSQAPDLTNALLDAGTRYDRYTARKDEWWDYVARRKRLEALTNHVEWLASSLNEIDILSRDDFARRVDPRQIDALVGSLRALGKETTLLAGGVQLIGRPRDLAEERWILELADIYENGFSRPARVWGAGKGPARRRDNFYRLLELCRPQSFFLHGKLSPKQIERTLKRRGKPHSAGPIYARGSGR